MSRVMGPSHAKMSINLAFARVALAKAGSGARDYPVDFPGSTLRKEDRPRISLITILTFGPILLK